MLFYFIPTAVFEGLSKEIDSVRLQGCTSKNHRICMEETPGGIQCDQVIFPTH